MQIAELRIENTLVISGGVCTSDVMNSRALLHGETIVCFASGDWWIMTPGSCRKIMERFAHANKVVFVNTVSPSLPKIGSRGFIHRVFRKLPSLIRVLRRPLRNLFVFTPLVLPTKGRPSVRKVNSILLAFQLKLLLFLLGAKTPILWIENLAAVDLLDKFKTACIIYYCSDKFDATRHLTSRHALRMQDLMLTQRSDAVICVSRMLYRFKKGLARHVFYLPHAVDYDHFASAIQQNQPLPEDMKGIKHPIIGYFGSLSDSNDLEILEFCARKRRDWSFVLIGRAMGSDFKNIRQLPNVYLLGYKDYDDIPRYGRHFDLCLLFWKLTDWIKFCNPVKTKEYLAMGKPIVSVPIPEIEEEFSQIVAVAATKEEFLEAISHELMTDTPEKHRQRMARVCEDTWDHYLHDASTVITAVLEEKNAR